MQLIRRRPPPDGHEDGFTLIELVISVAILGLVSAALCGVVLQYVQTSVDTSARLNESTDEQFISTYWQNDVSSLGRRSRGSGSFDVAQSVFVGSAGPGGCGSTAGSIVVAFAWNQFRAGAGDPDEAWSTTPQEVAYVTVPKDGRLVLERVRCTNGVAAAPLTIAHNLTATPAISCDTSCTAATPPNRVSMTFTVKDADNTRSSGYTTTVSADRRQS
ncbi:MAG: prepilin-type N-terminal cleavage/methylation domain-containing protein [Nocardioides sp.]